MQMRNSLSKNLVLSVSLVSILNLPAYYNAPEAKKVYVCRD